MAIVQQEDVPKIVSQILAGRGSEQARLRKIQRYYKGKHDSTYTPRDASREYKKIQDQARVNFLPLIVGVLAENLHVDGFHMSPPPIPKSVKVNIDSTTIPGTPGTNGTPQQIPAALGPAPSAPAPAKPQGNPSGAGGKVPTPSAAVAGGVKSPRTPASPGTAVARQVPAVPAVPAPAPVQIPKSVSVPTNLLFTDEISETTSPPWEIFKKNKMVSRQHGLYRSIMKYGLAYMLVLPAKIATDNETPSSSAKAFGPNTALMRPVSPLRMTAYYADEVDDEWALFAVEVFEMGTVGGKKTVIRLYDDNSRFTMIKEDRQEIRFVSEEDGLMDGSTAVDEHGLGVCPVVRFLHEIDLDGQTDVVGEVEPLIPIQDQVNSTTFNKMIAEAFASFRQRWVTGMGNISDPKGRVRRPFSPGIDRLWVAEDTDTKFGEFGQTDLKDYLDGIEKSLQHASTIAQVPPYQLLGLVANLSAEALAAARDGMDRKIQELQATLDEPWKQTFRLASHAAGDEKSAKDDGSYVVWRDTSARAFAATIDALGKMSQMLGVPAPELWGMIPGVSAEKVATWKASLAQPGVMEELAGLIEKAVTKGANTANPGTPGQPAYNQFESRPGGV